MIRRALMVTIAAMLISIPAVAGAATKKHKPKSHSMTLTVQIANINPPGPQAQGAQSYGGIFDGKVSGTPVHGAVRGVNNVTGTNFTGSITVFTADGSYTGRLTGSGGPGSVAGSITFHGSVNVTGGKGTYKGAKGTATFTGTTPPNGTVATFTASGTLKY